jgi:hypothetical protein
LTRSRIDSSRSLGLLLRTKLQAINKGHGAIVSAPVGPNVLLGLDNALSLRELNVKECDDWPG